MAHSSRSFGGVSSGNLSASSGTVGDGGGGVDFSIINLNLILMKIQSNRGYLLPSERSFTWLEI